MMIDKRLINQVAESRKWIALTVLWNVVALIASIISAFIFAFIISYAFHAEVNSQLMTSVVISLVLCLILRAWAGKKSVQSSYFASYQVKHHLRNIIYKKLSAMPLSQVQSQSTSNIIQVASEGVEQLEIYFGRYLPQLFYSLLAPLILFAVLIWFNVTSAIILLICVPLIPMSIIAVNKIAKKLLAKYWSIYVGLGSSFLDNLQGLITLKVYQDDAHQAKAMQAEAETFRKITMKVLVMQLNSVSLMDLLAYGGSALGIIASLWEFKNDNADVLTVILFILLSAEFFIPLRLLGSFFHVAMNGKAASEKIFRLLDEKIIENPHSEAYKNHEPIGINIQNLSFQYNPNNANKIALKNINLAIQPNTLNVFVGESGSGKSTLANLLMGFYQPTQGEIQLNQHNLNNIQRHDLYDHIALVSHSSYIFKGSVRDNMLMAKPKASDEEIYQCLSKVNLDKFIRENGGLDMALLSRGSNLSGGQIQRLALARALLHDAQCYIFDEATSNIDVESEELILSYLKELKQTKTIIMISHRVANACLADQVFVLNHGELAEQGTHHDLMVKNGLYHRLFTEQANLEKIRNDDAQSKAKQDGEGGEE